ncbi:DUF3995 domain-containing protein [Saliterribacillus persicus]|uniref:Uncharacterized protein DUF3995 n=1 Tax=Saliterribacillus persicus TaxID=930114 RepID=A0A368YCU4_9BACI|nr:DUF3995 domain-containing protein [Saliterribacillus persicus]RCW77156.1 uncharacterized protein DUF3995 [Saliterribacillus persicus]
MQHFFVWVTVIILGFISLLHFYWLFGGKRGILAVIPENGDREKSFMPKWYQTFIVAAGLLIMALILLIQNNAIPYFTPNTITKSFTAFFTLIFFMRAIGDFKYMGFFKKVNKTTFSTYDTRIYSPLCLFLGFIFLVSFLF